MASDGAGEVPDFASLYGDARPLLRPRLAACLWAAAGVLSDTYGEAGGRSMLVEDLPPIAARVADDAWCDRFLACFDTLADRLAAGGFDREKLACCTGEEMALHLMIDMVETLTETGALDAMGWMARLAPGDGEEDGGTVWAREALLRDHDVLSLYEASLDGIEAPDSDENLYYGLAHLHPRDWFTRFDDCPQ